MIKKIKLDDDAAKLGQAYVNSKDGDWDTLVNKAVKYYIFKHCSHQKLQKLRQADGNDAVDFRDIFKNLSNMYD